MHTTCSLVVAPVTVIHGSLLKAVQQPLGVVTCTVPLRPLAPNDWLAGEIEIGLETVVTAVEELLPVFGSKVNEVTIAILLNVAPLAAEQSTLATKVIVTEAPGTSEGRVTV